MRATRVANAMKRERTRCQWGKGDMSPEMIRYHDEEWGRAVHSDAKLFEMLTLEGAQAGLSWQTVLKKRDAYRSAFHEFDIERVAAMDETVDVERLMGDAGLIRHKGKLKSVINNAKRIVHLRTETKQSFTDYLWSFLEAENERQHGQRDRVPQRHDAEPCSKNGLSDAMAAALRKAGFSFVGSTTMYSLAQAVGMALDHSPSCFLYDRAAGRPERPTEENATTGRAKKARTSK